MQHPWIDFALSIAPFYVVVGFTLGFGFVGIWVAIFVSEERSVPITVPISVGLFCGLYCAVFVGGTAAVFGYPLLFIVPWPVEVQEFLLSLLYFPEVDYQWAVGINALIFLFLLIGCSWVELGRDPPSPFRPPSNHNKEAWNNFVYDAQLTPAFEALSKGQKSGSWAFEFFKRFADQGNAAAQNNLALMFATGWGVEKSSDKAEDYFRSAAAQGLRTAQVCLAGILIVDLSYADPGQYDEEASRRLVESYKWVLIAKMQRYPLTHSDIKWRMTSAQISEAEHLAQLWLDQHHVVRSHVLMYVIREALRVLHWKLWAPRRAHVHSKVKEGFRRLAIVLGMLLGLGITAIGFLVDEPLWGGLIGGILFLAQLNRLEGSIRVKPLIFLFRTCESRHYKA